MHMDPWSCAKSLVSSSFTFIFFLELGLSLKLGSSFFFNETQLRLGTLVVGRGRSTQKINKLRTKKKNIFKKKKRGFGTAYPPNWGEPRQSAVDQPPAVAAGACGFVFTKKIKIISLRPRADSRARLTAGSDLYFFNFFLVQPTRASTLALRRDPLGARDQLGQLVCCVCFFLFFLF
jgi:hypothetical protein